MSLITKKLSFSAEISTGNKSYSGLGFTPKAVLFWLTSQAATGFNAGRTLSVGAMTSATDMWCVATVSNDNVAVSTGNGRRHTAAEVLYGLTVAGGTVSIELSAAAVSLDADGFTINYDVTSAGKNYIIHALAVGGTDLVSAKAGNVQTPIVTGNQAHTGVGFQPDCLFLATLTQPTLPGSFTGGRVGFGMAVSPTQRAAFALNEDTTIPSTVNQRQVSDKIIATTAGDGTDAMVADLVSMDSDGWTANYTVVQASARFVFYLALKGGRYSVAAETQKTSTGTKAKTGLGFQPTGLLLMGVNAAANASVDNTQAKLSFGASDGTTEGAIWGSTTDNVNPTDANTATVTDKIMRHATNPSTTDAEADLSSFDSGGYTLDWTTADGTAREFIGLAFGSVAAPVSNEAALRTAHTPVTWRT